MRTRMLDHVGSSQSYPYRRSLSVPALQPYIIEPIWEQFEALLPEREIDHPLGCHRPRIPDRVVFEKLVAVLVFGCITKAPCGGDKSGTSPVDRGKRGIKRSTMVDANGIPLAVVAAGANRHDSPLLCPTLDAADGKPTARRLWSCPSRPASTSIGPTTRGRPASF